MKNLAQILSMVIELALVLEEDQDLGLTDEQQVAFNDLFMTLDRVSTLFPDALPIAS